VKLKQAEDKKSAVEGSPLLQAATLSVVVDSAQEQEPVGQIPNVD
jgi:hypothetical protein